ncbi:putative virion structural protein [Serratia phage vB_SmaS-Totoro]|nr:putative virion structural protein [Serratia phage vB_SmaS-Totoro]
MASYDDTLRKNLDMVFRAGGLGSKYGQVFENFFGYNYRARGAVVAANKDQVGLTFFTKPDLNLHRDNVTQDRHLTPLISSNPITIPSAIRAYLDPNGSIDPAFGYSTPLVNPKGAFISILTNGLKSLSGFPDNAVGTYTSPEGIMGEQWTMADGPYHVRGAYQLTASFTNMDGNPFIRLFDVWEAYMENIRTKKMAPWPRNRYRNCIDYTCRVYRLILDPTRRFVQQIAGTGYSFPTTNPQGGTFNFDNDDNYDRSNDTVTVQFNSVGAIYNDPLLIEAFNQTTAKFNPDLAIVNKSKLTREEIRVKSNNYYRVTPEQRDLCNFYSYPLIHPCTYELCWFIEKDVYNRLRGADSSTPLYRYDEMPADPLGEFGYDQSILDAGNNNG